MIDSMTRDDVLSALGEISKHFEDCTKGTCSSIHELFHRWMNAADWAAAYLNDPAPTVSGWISVKDRLPYVDKDSGYECEVLAIVSGYDTESKCRYDHGFTLMTYSSIPELKSEWYQSDTFAPLMVHYWQSLPEPPEEDANGESKI